MELVTLNTIFSVVRLKTRDDGEAPGRQLVRNSTRMTRAN